MKYFSRRTSSRNFRENRPWIFDRAAYVIVRKKTSRRRLRVSLCENNRHGHITNLSLWIVVHCLPHTARRMIARTDERIVLYRCVLFAFWWRKRTCFRVRDVRSGTVAEWSDFFRATACWLRNYPYFWKLENCIFNSPWEIFISYEKSHIWWLAWWLY